MTSGDFQGFIIAAVATFLLMFIVVPMILGVFRLLGLYVMVPEGRCCVYVLFGKVIGIIREPGLHFLPFHIGTSAFLVHWFGKVETVDLRMDQEYLRSQAVNSEEGAPMGIGIWYEMYISDPVAYLFKNADPRGSLRTNVSNATVRCLSNMPLSELLENRHQMSRTVRTEVSEKSEEWGYGLGSIYIRKVHFRDKGMIRQIEEKVVNRLRQVTSAIRQDGVNQVSIIASTAEREAAVEFAKAAAVRPLVVGMALHEIGEDSEIQSAMFEILEQQKLIKSDANITLIPEKSDALAALITSESLSRPVSPQASRPDRGKPTVG